MLGSWLALGACNGSPVGVVGDEAGGSEGGGGDATPEASGDATMDAGSDGPTGNDAPTDGTMPMNEASVDANDGGGAETGAETGADTGSDAGAETGTEAGADAPSEAAQEASADGPSEAAEEASTDAPTEAASDASGDAPLEAAACTNAGTWSMTVQTVTAVPTFCQGVMDCTNCGILFNATATQPTATTIDWSVNPGGTLCTAFSGTITPAGQFATNETDCTQVAPTSTFNGQIDLSTCSMTATYVYVLSSCTITETMTGTQ
jgi:hypothetical protein